MSIVKFKNFSYLRGPKGDKGDKGDPGRGINGTTGRITYVASTGIVGFDDEGLATESFVNSAVSQIDLTGYATETYVDSAVNSAVTSLVDNAPTLLDTLNEIAAALGDDPSFITTVNANIASKLSLTGGTLTGSLILNADPVNELEAATKQYVDDELATVVGGLASTTDDITEGITNLYYTDTRARSAISVEGAGSYDTSTGVITVTGGVTSVNTQTGAVELTTTDINEGTNLYYTDARVRLAITAGTNINYDSATGIISSTSAVESVNGQTGTVALITDDVTEGANQYYTDSRARAAISASGDLSYDPSTGIISYTMPAVVVDLTGDFDGGDYTELPEYGNSTIIIGGGIYDVTPILPVFNSVEDRDLAFPAPAAGTMVLTSGSVEVYSGTTWLVLTAAEDSGGF